MFNINSDKTKRAKEQQLEFRGISNAFFADHPLGRLAICSFDLNSILCSSVEVELEFLTLKCYDIYCHL